MAKLWKNWAQNQACAPFAQERPTSESELVDIVKTAAANERRVKVVGAGHSFTGIACTDGHLVDMSGYDTVVDVQVPSGGQKRLIALARCLLRQPEVLLLDEPTENLDADQRARLTGVIREYAHDRTCIVVSHDMDFIAAVADRILVLEDGRVAQQGDHRTLMAEGGLYKRLYEAQKVDPRLVYSASERQPPEG